MGHKLVFNGIDSSDYGIIISGAGTYATPERDITSLSVPGRNGDIHFDNGRYNNIQVTYECGISKGFESKYLPFMRQMLSAPIYSRLEDDYHLDEFRLGTFRAEMVPDVGTIMRSGKFELVFDCKPQRFLKAGERVALTVEGTSASSLFVSEGILNKSATASFKSANATFMNAYGDRRITVIGGADAQLWASNGIHIRLYYDDAKVGDMFVYGTGDNPLAGTWTDGYIQSGIVYKPVTNLGQSVSDPDYTYTTTFLNASHPYVWFETPSRWEVVAAMGPDIGQVYDTDFPDYAVINNPTRFAASPMLKISLPASHIMDDRAVAVVNGSQIRMTFDSNQIIIGQFAQTVSDIYIDCETMNAFTHLANTQNPYNMNQYVSLPERSIVLDAGDNDIYCNDLIDSIEIIPNWWRL